MPAITALPALTAARIAGGSSNRSQWTAEVLSAFARSMSSSAMPMMRPAPGDFNVALVLDAAQFGERDGAFARVREFDHHRGFPVTAVRDQRIVGVQFLPDTRCLEDALDAQHFLHLVLDREAILEYPGHVRADGYGAVALVLDDAGAEGVALARVLFEPHQVGRGQHLSIVANPSHMPYAWRSSVTGCRGSRASESPVAIWCAASGQSLVSCAAGSAETRWTTGLAIFIDTSWYSFLMA